MKYHIDTIPVWDAFQADCECPLCGLRLKNEAMYLDNFLGASVMEPDVRVEVNEKGFCHHHFDQMLQAKNRLGLALMTHTHLKERIKGFEKAAAALESAPAKRLFGGVKEGDSTQQAQDLARHEESCILCQRLNQTMERYLYTTIHLWQTDPAFRKAFEGSKGFCLGHFGQLAEMALKNFGTAERKAFLASMIALERENLARLEQEIEWFTLKFDYRNQDKPWGNSKDAPERAIEKLVGKHREE